MTDQRGKMWLILVMFVAAALGGAAGGYWFYTRPGGAEAGVHAKPPTPGPMYQVGTVVTNLNEAGAPMYVQVGLELEADSEAALRELEQRQGAVRDAVIQVLRAKSYDDLRGAEGMAAVATETRAAINQLLVRGAIEKVYFTEFIVQ